MIIVYTVIFIISAHGNNLKNTYLVKHRSQPPEQQHSLTCSTLLRSNSLLTKERQTNKCVY